jgi:uncharacterized membrane protein
MTRYELFKWLHVMGGITWLGAGIGLSIVAWRLRKAGDHDAIVAIYQREKDLSNFIFMPASLITIVFGLLMVFTEDVLGFSDLWILIGIGGVVLSFVAAVGMAAPAGKRYMDAVGSDGPGSPAAIAALSKVSRLNMVDVLILTVVVWAMVAKPML